MHLPAEHGHVVLAVRIIWIHAKNVFRGDEAHVLLSKDAVLARVSRIPLKLLPDNLNHRGFAFRWEFIHGLGPERHSDADQQHALHDGDRSFDII